MRFNPNELIEKFVVIDEKTPGKITLEDDVIISKGLSSPGVKFYSKKIFGVDFSMVVYYNKKEVEAVLILSDEFSACTYDTKGFRKWRNI